MSDAPSNNTRKAVYTVVDNGNSKSRWVRIGIAFPNRDGSYNISLDALPVNGKLHMREFRERDDETAAQ